MIVVGVIGIVTCVVGAIIKKCKFRCEEVNENSLHEELEVNVVDDNKENHEVTNITEQEDGAAQELISEAEKIEVDELAYVLTEDEIKALTK